MNSETKLIGYGAQEGIDTRYLEQAVRNIKKACNGGTKVVVICSTVPLGMSSQIQSILSNPMTDTEFIVLCNPEFFVEGQMVS